MQITEALKAQEEEVDALLRSATKYVSTLKGWKKACQLGHVTNLKKNASTAVEQADALREPTRNAAESWTFDVQEYLESGAWREELQNVCRVQFGLRVFEEEETIVSPPILARAQPGSLRLQLGKVAWPTLHPTVTGKYLKSLSEKSASIAANQQFLNSIYDAAKRVRRQGDNFVLFRDIYDLFSFAPGWAKENSPAAFAQQIYLMDRSEVRTTRDGKSYQMEFPSGKPKDRDIFSVIAEDGRTIRYYGIWFQGEN